MKTSIVIPVYNVRDYLERCVASALALKSEVEILLVDDGSTDGSGELCDALAQTDGRVRVVHQENGGLSAARNTGIQNASGDHILFLDSDDFLDPSETDAILTELRPDTDVLLGLYRNYYADGERYEAEQCGAFLTMEGSVPIENFLRAVPADGQSCYMVAVRFVSRRDFLLANGLLFLPGIYHEDEEWTARLLGAADAVTVTHRYFYQYRQAREGSIMANGGAKHIFDRYIILERMETQRETARPCVRVYLDERMGQIYLNNLIHHAALRGEEKKRSLAMLRHFRKQCVPAMHGMVGRAAAVSVRLIGPGGTSRLLYAAWRAKNK